MKPISFWVPATFCGVICFVALFGSVVQDTKWWRPTFYAFLPMCFFFVGSIMLRMNREIGRLRHRIGRLEQTRHREAPRSTQAAAPPAESPDPDPHSIER